ncbi:MAG TPA: helix-turn-helix domain-containing GNAT family N-acetyltransferase [Vicinamibacterales bacterium]|nr:helix-turn-helix domain-containing GNAT family N-acetyltransferase [Vicinamibacterales bacterium]
MADPHVAVVRRFNRFYTRQIGLLDDGLLQTPFSLTEARVLYELAHGHGMTATALRSLLGLDAGYVSRMLRGFERRGLIRRERSARDRRESHVHLTAKGRAAFSSLNTRQERQVAGMIGKLPARERGELTSAMRSIERLLGASPEPLATRWALREPRAGDMGWVVHRHGVLYAKEYGWDARFEALVARIVADFVDRFDPARERCWIAEQSGQIVGSVFLVKVNDEVAKLRLLLVEPSARGTGLGKALVSACVDFARQAGYRKVTLWTQSVLAAARHIYDRAGFVLVSSEPSESFGHRLVSETWELTLA